MHLFKELFSLIYSDLYNFIYSIALNQHLAEDILQETAIIGYKNFDDLKDKDKFKSWIFTIAKREAIRKIRQNSREIIMIQPEQYQNLVRDSSIEMAVFEDNVETHMAVIEALKKLPPEYKDIIDLVYYSGFSLTEVAEMMNSNYNTIKSRHLRALQMLKKILEEKGFVSY